MMPTRAALPIVVALTLLAACSTAPDAGREGTAGGSDASRGGSGGTGGSGAGPANLATGDAKERERLLFELDQRVGDWQNLQAEGRTGARLNVEKVIADVVDGSFAELLRYAGSTATDDKRGRLIAAKAIGFARRDEHRKRAGAALADLLRSGDDVLIEYALFGFYVRRDEGDPIDLVASHLGAESPGVRRNAALAIYQMARKGARLSETAAPVARSRLLAQAHDREDANVRAAAAAALGQVGTRDDPAYEDTLINLLADADLRVRLRAIVALASIGGASSLDPLCDQVAHELPNIRHHAALALAIVTNRLGYRLDASMLGEDAEAWRKAIRARQDG